MQHKANLAIRFNYILLTAFCFIINACQQDQTNFSTWQVYKGDAGARSYSALNQINKDNVGQLEVIWTFYPNDVQGRYRAGKYESNPIVIGDVMYFTSDWHWLYAIKAVSGEKIWSFDPFDGGRGGGIMRGVAYWNDKDDERILFTAKNFLYAINAKTGHPILGFGDNGKVNLNILEGDEPEAWVVPTSPGIVYKDLLILGAEVSEYYGAAPGHIRAYDIKTGTLRWTFHTIPMPGEIGYDTWPPDAWQYVGGANNWGGMSLDVDRGIVFVPTGSPTYDFYGADRKGENLFGNSIVALNAATGEYIWHFQTIHHDVWDYDLPAAPSLVTVERDGKKIDAIAQTSKVGFLYVLSRETGESLFPIEEKTVPQTKIPGEETWPTQPFPLKPASYVRQSMTSNDLNKFSLESYDSIYQDFNELRFEGLFTPPDISGTLMIPGTRGGSEWGGSAYDPETNIIYINANESPEIAKIKKVNKTNSKIGGTLYDVGKNFYTRYCVACHGANKEGVDLTPSIKDIDQRLNRTEIINQIKIGKGRMPSFTGIVDGQEDEILAYLTETGKDQLSSSASVVLDTTTIYKNLTAYSHFRDSKRRPVLTPPWGTLSAINLNTGDYAWKIPLGNHPELQQPGSPPTGMENYGGPVVTAGALVFMAGTMDNMFRAFDKTNGELIWETTLPGPGFATPSIYQLNGKQYIAISVTGNQENPGGGIVVFSLPDK
ncbi:MAG: PQQ-binding-like beta-propeller repeat protein [Bacteroidetes bacterium]|nr:PQQ-binding-like beta-propeller repeat protein [Bacteroidota bacterium]MDA1122181.1 PQQ-binding-like beta-propeller repeat protein [Bacteroidota bacterium]